MATGSAVQRAASPRTSCAERPARLLASRPARCLDAVLRSLVVVLSLAAASVHAQSPVRSFDVVEKDGAYVATVVMSAPVPPDVAWGVLTDFDNMQKWVPNVRVSKALSRDGDTVTVEQRGTAKFGLLSFPYTSVRRMQLAPQRTIQSTQVTGSMRRLVSLMTLSPDGAITRLDYRLELEPSGLAATVMSKEFLQHEITEQFTAIVNEMVRRTK